MEAIVPPEAPRIGENERLSATLVLSLIVHGMLVLGLGFALDDNAPAVPTLDVILSQTQTPLTPKEADFLAAASQEGGGEHEQARRPRDNQAGHVPLVEPGTAPEPLRALSPAPAPLPEDRVLATSQSTLKVAKPPEQVQPEIPETPANDAKQQHDANMARLAAEYHLRSELYAKRPKRKFVSASTREYEYANYLRAWVDRAERVGNLNYPDEARRRRLSGQVVISVAVRRDGSVENARIIRSSGVPLLDSAAMRIVDMAEPFPPLPETRDNIDILHVTRTWNFLPGGEVRDE